MVVVLADVCSGRFVFCVFFVLAVVCAVVNLFFLCVLFKHVSLVGQVRRLCALCVV